jgi:hypothetical protein
LHGQPAFDKKQFVTFMKRYIKNLIAKLDVEQSDVFKKNIEVATKYLLGKLMTFSCKFYVPFYHHFALVDVMFSWKI